MDVPIFKSLQKLQKMLFGSTITKGVGNKQEGTIALVSSFVVQCTTPPGPMLTLDLGTGGTRHRVWVRHRAGRGISYLPK